MMRNRTARPHVSRPSRHSAKSGPGSGSSTSGTASTSSTSASSPSTKASGACTSAPSSTAGQNDGGDTPEAAATQDSSLSPSVSNESFRPSGPLQDHFGEAA